MSYKIDGYDAEDFLIEALREGSLTDAEARAAYSRMRSVANKRLAALGRSKYANTQAFIRNAGKYTRLSTIEKSTDPSKPSRELAYKLADLYKFLNTKSGSVTGQRAIEKSAIDTLNERGFGFINLGNIKNFGEYMEEARQRGLVKIYGSERVASMYPVAERKGFDPKEILSDFEFWNNNRKKLEEMPRIRNAENRTADAYRAKLQKKGD